MQSMKVQYSETFKRITTNLLQMYFLPHVILQCLAVCYLIN